MTNNPTIDGVSRVIPDELLGAAIETISEAFVGTSVERDLRALLDAPAVERQELKPAARICGAGYDEKGSTVWMEIGVEEMPISRRVELGEKLVFMGDAQSTIAKLQARITQLESEAVYAAAGYQAARDRIAELESGRGEADAWALLNGNGQIRDLTDRWDVAKHWDGYVQSLYFAPPAPVAVVLPDLSELREYHAKAVENLTHYADDSGLRESDVKHYRKRAEFHAECLSRIDATAALNEVPK